MALMPTARIEQFLLDHPELPTPFLVVDLDVVAERYRTLCEALPRAAVYYAVKANPDPAVVRLLVDLGCDFDVASPAEVDLCLGIGARPEQLSYGNTVKKEADVAHAAGRGVGTFAVDCAQELEKVIRSAPGSLVMVRLAVDGAGADWPLSRKFGCGPQDAAALLRTAATAGHPVGVGFHVGSQQHDPDAWDAPLAVVARLADTLAAGGVRLSAVNLGGGLPSRHAEPTPPIAEFGRRIEAAIDRHLAGADLRFLVEPGRFLVGDAGLLRTEVVLTSRRDSDPGRRWVYLDVGMFSGLVETAEEAIRYRIRVPRPHGATEPAVLAGPTCDSLDVLYERRPYPLPVDLQPGDRLDLLSTGAYTTSYSSVGFNGFAPLRAHHLPRSTDGTRSSAEAVRDGAAVPGS
jgi:ornithine decarboxylase